MTGDQHQSNLIGARTIHDLLGGVAIIHLRLARHASFPHPHGHALQIAFGLCPAQLPLQRIHRAQTVLLIQPGKDVQEYQLRIKTTRQRDRVRQDTRSQQ